MKACTFRKKKPSIIIEQLIIQKLSDPEILLRMERAEHVQRVHDITNEIDRIQKMKQEELPKEIRNNPDLKKKVLVTEE